MKIAWFFIFLVFAVNVSSGIVTSWLGPYTGNQMGGLSGYNEKHGNVFADPAFEEPIGTAVETGGSSSDTASIWDLLGLSFVQTWVSTANKYLHGVNSMLYSVIGAPYMTNDESMFSADETFAQANQKSQLETWFGCGTPADCEGVNTMGDANHNYGIIGWIIKSMYTLAFIGLFIGKNLFED